MTKLETSFDTIQGSLAQQSVQVAHNHLAVSASLTRPF